MAFQDRKFHELLLALSPEIQDFGTVDKMDKTTEKKKQTFLNSNDMWKACKFEHLGLQTVMVL